MPEIMIAIRPGTVYLNGARRMVRKGRTTAHATHEIVRKHPRMWAPIRVDYPAPDDITGDILGDTTGDTGPDTPATPAATSEATPAPLDVAENATLTPAQVRTWARENGIDVSPKGKIPADVVERYQAAHGG